MPQQQSDAVRERATNRRNGALIATLFDAEWYLEENPDVLINGADPLNHYLAIGATEGRNPNPLFLSSWYSKQAGLSPELNPLEHYVQIGLDAGCEPNPIFDSTWYLGQDPALSHDSEVLPIVHYLVTGAREGLDPHPLFDTDWYIAQYPEAATAANPLQHYLRWGAKHGLNPHPLFDTAYYTSTRESDLNDMSPLEHYLARGAAEGASPHPLFDTRFYRQQLTSITSGEVNPLVHFLTEGAWQGLDPHPLFATEWYLSRNPELAEARRNPLVDYVLRGWRERRAPHPNFDVEFYRRQNVSPDIGNPLQHYITVGKARGLTPRYAATFSFGKGTDADEIKLAGWHEAEKDFTWSDGTDASIVVDIPVVSQPATASVTFILNGMMAPPELRYQPVAVYVEQTKVADWEVGEKQRFSFVVPAELAERGGAITVKLATPRADSPSRLGTADDPRTLGVCCWEVQVEPGMPSRTSVKRAG